ncbi:MAG: hypothetical protein HXX08_09880 [Chloroflexi bacterium]|uniref:SGNH hydrolase-type esterase domain-containing protein n=1 Tax=Candidatus Chlorohelix allophototropha TaxID=3003348 RepID=A0A8T7M384_9CHLR|nr:hypothetical protein [Chloroflexota bacterium]WJW65553.1 hypothetical protein OZ401_001320 [Chloroflexota bacterium L227-S17]
MRTKIIPLISVVLLLLTTVTTLLTPSQTALAAPVFGSCQFRQMWNYSDKVVDEVPGSGRGFTWGSNTFGVFTEPYLQAPQGKRIVQYFDKNRMEWNGSSLTNGLLTKELVTGQLQVGDFSYSQRGSSEIPVAGDNNVNNPSPTYASFKNLVSLFPGAYSAPNQIGKQLVNALDRNGQVYQLVVLPASLTIAAYDTALSHNIPSVFVDYQHRKGQIWNGKRFVEGNIFTDNPVANVFGLPISEAYWVRATVGGKEKDVLVQLFERRVLTYTPSNPSEFQVEMGNVGQHYVNWRYEGKLGIMSESCPASAMPVVVSNPRIFAVGDSVMLGASAALESTFPNIVIDAAVSRQAFVGINILNTQRARGALGDVVVVHLGNNGTFSQADFDDLMDVLSDVGEVVIINNKVPRSWEDSNNALLAANAKRYSNVVLINWHDFGYANPQFFWDDGIHLRPDGAKAYAQLIASKI